jgi:hypothetical protein
VHAPALVDVAHQIDVRADRVADFACALDFLRGRGITRQRKLHLHLLEALLDQQWRRLRDVLQRV